ncbi:alpha-hydroxy acid oxidase [Arthrobacter sp. NPDC056727]|uniref:alpha-hydroxy acid oxidase n=1 Tax=Arthrobacter sp. NPDC056727 TaxID=3345927 RepID=UPI00366C1B9B
MSGVGSSRLTGLLNYEDVRSAAARRVPRSIFEYVDGGAEDEVTLKANREAFAELSFAPRNGVWVGDPQLKTTVLGQNISMPVLTAPCGGMRLLHPDGDLAVARAAAAAGTIHVATSASGFSLEEIADVPGLKVFQAYRFSNEKAMKSLVERARTAGYFGLMATIDTPVAGIRERDFRNGFSYDMRINLRNIVRMAPKVINRPGWVLRFMRDGMPFALPNTADITPDGKPMELSSLSRTGKESHSPSWDDIVWMRRYWDGPLIIKGVLTVADAHRAKALGADAIVVSNHGGRQLDGAPATIRALAAIVEAVGDGAEVLLDSGVRRGSDVVKALATGARAVLVGRAAAYGLAAGGQPGVEHVLAQLNNQLTRTMQLLGAGSVEELDETWLTPAASAAQENVAVGAP